MRKVKVSIIIPVYNQEEYTTKCLSAIYGNTFGINYEIIIIDNASDRMMNVVDKVIHNKVNVGVANAWNQGARSARGEYLCFLNNDTEVQPGWLYKLLEEIEKDETIGIAGSKLILPDGRDTRMSDKYISGGCFLTPREVFFDVWGMESRYFAYFEDVDYCKKLQEKGYKLKYVPESVVIHHVAKTSSTLEGGYQKVGEESQKLFEKKWGKHEN